MIKVQKITLESNNDLMNWNCSYANSKANNDVKYTARSFYSWKEVFTVYGDLPYIVYYNNKFIGFFFDDYDDQSDAIGLSVYLPYHSKMKFNISALNTLIFVGIMHNWFIYQQSNHKYLEFNTFTKHIKDMVLGIIPNINVATIRSTYIIMYGEINMLDLTNVKRYFDTFLDYYLEDGYVFTLPEYILLSLEGDKKKKLNLLGG